MKRIFFLLLFLPFLTLAQQPHAARIKLKLKKLNFLGSVLYVAAHPDDENTRIITYMANDKLATTAYLSMTRGDGGQNLIGPEMRDLLGLIRTQELLAARRIDGGEQFFTRANDFGFSKSATETFEIWGKEQVLHDVVKVYRDYQPDIIITRFPPDERAGHGHHTASAMLAQEAFDLAAQPNAYPELARQVGVWQVKRLYTNTGRWWNNTINESTPGVITLNVGGYSPLLGESFSEIAAVSRSQHKSQGFGSRGTRGDQLEYLEYVKGERATKDIFEGINTTWTRLKGGEKIQPIVTRLIQEYNEDHPAASVPLLFTLRKQLLALENSVWKTRKLAETEALIQDCLGLFIEATANQYWVAPGEDVQVSIELVNRSSVDVTLQQFQSSELSIDSTLAITLKNNIPVLFKTKKQIRPGKSYSDPYWLQQPHTLGAFTVNDPALIGLPENPPAVPIRFSVLVNGEHLSITRPLVYKWTDPVKGELMRPFEVVPPVFINLSDPVIVFPDGAAKPVKVLLKSASGRPVKGELSLQLPEGWTAEPASVPFELLKTGEEQSRTFTVTPAPREMTGALKATAAIDGKRYGKAIQVIGYDHIPIQTLLPDAQAKLVRLDLKNTGGMIGYIKGAGDDIPQALRNMGFEVWEMKNEEVTAANLKRVDAVVLGVRALNTNERIRFMMPDLLEYVKNGGTLVVQYNTSFDLETDAYSPYTLKISRDRVTDEDSDVRILKPDHRVMQYPNKITAADFKGWVQERGLYFPNSWDEKFQPILSMNDSGETPKDGSLLVAQYGSGYYVYTGLSFFRQLPEGVAGAYKLFANLVSLSRQQPATNPAVKKKGR
jgi:LmbE family N-acetylglucosaminyl deacetylase